MKAALLLPAVIFYIIFTAWPLVEVVRLSLYKTNFITTTFIGINNYIASFKDEVFLKSMLNSFFYVLFMVPMQVIFSVGVSLGIFGLSKKWHDVGRIIFYLPTLSAGIIIAQLWKWFFHMDGVANWILSSIGINSINWFGQTSTAIPVISTIIVFSSFGGNVIIVLASLLSIDKNIIEAALMDGAGWIRIKLSIMLPMIKKTIWLVVLLTAISALQIFETIFALAPYDYSATMAFHVYRQGFQWGKYGMASAQAVILLFVTVLLTIVKNKLVDDNE